MYYMTSTQTVRLGPEHGSSRGFYFYGKSNFGRGPDNLDYNEMGSRDWHGREMGRPDRRRYDSSSGQHHHPCGLRRDYGGNYDAPMQEFKREHGQSHVAEDVGWSSDAQGYRGTAFRQDNWRRGGGPSSADPGYAPGLDKRQRFGGPDYTSRLEGPQGGPRVGPICKSDLDEAMEITRSTWCWACCEHMAETPAVVRAHLTSPEHIRNRTKYRHQRKYYVLGVVNNILKESLYSALLDKFKMNPDAGQEIFQMFHAESKGQGPKDKARPQGTEEALGNSDSAAEESVEATDDDKVVPQKVDHNDPAKSCSVDDAAEEGAVDLTEKGKGQEAGGTSVENFESEAKGVKKYVEVSDSESTIDFEHGVVVHHDENETASDPQSDREECEELDNYDDDCDYEAGEVVQIDDDVE
ncbi:uncharacterized protein LOC116953222 isoform X6 [Petromyzon marinus]|uniref:uncharacterized protein LOC116953222 isoform X6 n=1 Tax=Petromyzon marinus TaxID=7757 RepID=UPI003F72A02D